MVYFGVSAPSVCVVNMVDNCMSHLNHVAKPKHTPLIVRDTNWHYVGGTPKSMLPYKLLVQRFIHAMASNHELEEELELIGTR